MVGLVRIIYLGGLFIRGKEGQSIGGAASRIGLRQSKKAQLVKSTGYSFICNYPFASK